MKAVAVALFVFALLGFTVLAGCSDAKPAAKAEEQPTTFEDLDVAATETTGILIGVVVDDAIRPLAGATVGITGAASVILEQVTDDTGRFAFDELEAGTYFVSAKLLNYADAQTAVEVIAGDDEPPAVRVQLTRLFSQDPFMDMIKFDGFLQCAHAIGVSTTCVNDYTRVVGERCTPPPAPPVCTTQCRGGCLRDYNLSAAGGNKREYVSSVAAGWQTIIWEAVWNPTSQFGEELGFTVSYFSRPNANHNFGGTEGASPLRFEEPVGDEDSSAGAGEPTKIPEEGSNEIFTFFSAAFLGVVINQAFTSFESHFYYGLPPEGWSFANNDPLPF